MPAAYILVLSDPRGLAWVLTRERMAWQRHSASVGKIVDPGDRLFIYASRNALPVAGGVIIGEAVALEPLRELDPPETLGIRLLTHGLDLRLVSLARPQDAVALKLLVPQIPAFGYERNPRAWPGHLQRGLVRVGPSGTEILDTNLARSDDLEASRDEYLLLAGADG